MNKEILNYILSLSYAEFTKIKKENSKIGRPQKYNTEQERKEARKNTLKKYRDKKIK